MPGERAVDRDRERAVAALRAGWVAGAVSTDTFEARLTLALGATARSELRSLTHDLPQALSGWRRRVARLLAGAGGRSSEVLLLRVAEHEGDITLGRNRSCTRIYDDDSVSRRHAVIRRGRAGWRLHDLGSLNGTWLNGVRIDGSARVCDGDEVRLGRVRLEVRLEA